MKTLMELIGLAGASIVMVSNIPQMVMFWRNGHAKGISLLGNWVGFVGLALRTIYLWHTTHGDTVSLAPYFFALACTIFTFYYLYFPKSTLSPIKRCANCVCKK